MYGRKAKPALRTQDKCLLRLERFLARQEALKKEYFEQIRNDALETLSITVLHESDYLVEVPPHLSDEWLVCERPEGRRAILVASGGKATLFTKAGFTIATFNTALPPSGVTLLDCIVARLPDEAAPHPPGSSTTSKKRAKKPTAFVCDCIVWNDCVVGDTPAECRFFMLRSRMEELHDALSVLSSTNGWRLKMVDVADARPHEIERLYHKRSADEDCIPDSLLFVHKEAIYTSGVSGLYLCWRDTHTSRFPIDTQDWTGASIPPYQQANLRLRLEDGTVLTEDRYAVGKIPMDSLVPKLSALPDSIYKNRWKRGRAPQELFIRVVFKGLNLEEAPPDAPAGNNSDSRECPNNGDPSSVELPGEEVPHFLVGMELLGTPSPQRIQAETLGRLVHQFILRQAHWRSTSQDLIPTGTVLYEGPLVDFQRIIECAASGESFSRMMLLQGVTHLEDLIEEEEESNNKSVEEQLGEALGGDDEELLEEGVDDLASWC